MNISHFGLQRQYVNLKDELLDATDGVLSSGVLMSGPYTTKFENWLCERTGAKYAVTVHSGTQALEIIARHAAIRDAELRNHSVPYIPPPKITLPNITYRATLNAFITTGWEVTLGDTDNDGILQTPDKIDDPYWREDTHWCVVGLFGARPWPKYSLMDHSRVIVDGAQHWLVAGDNIGFGMAISFDPTKNLPSSGNGGAIVTNDDRLYDYALTYRNNGVDPKTNMNWIRDECAGTNSRMSEQECAQILVRTKYLDEWQERRRKIKDYWCEQFTGIVRCLSAGVEHHSDQKFVLASPYNIELGKFLEENGINTKVHYPYTLKELPVAREFSAPNCLDTSTVLGKRLLSLPIYPELDDVEVEYIAQTIKEFYAD